MPDITQLVGFKMYAGFVNKTTGEAVYVDAIIRGAERRAYDGNVTLTVDAPAGSTLSELSGWTTKTHLMAIALAEADNTADLKAIVDGALNEASPSKEPIQLTLKGQGSGVDSGSAVFRCCRKKGNLGLCRGRKNEWNVAGGCVYAEKRQR